MYSRVNEIHGRRLTLWASLVCVLAVATTTLSGCTAPSKPSSQPASSLMTTYSPSVPSAKPTPTKKLTASEKAAAARKEAARKKKAAAAKKKREAEARAAEASASAEAQAQAEAEASAAAEAAAAAEASPTQDSNSNSNSMGWRDLGDFSYTVPDTYDCYADAGFGCGVMMVRANTDCPIGIYVKVAHYSGMTIVGWQNTSSGPLAAGETARLDFPFTEPGDTGGGFGMDWDLTDEYGCS